MGTTGALSVHYSILKRSGVVLWTVRREGQREIVANGATSNIRKAKRQAEHAMRMATNQHKEK